MCTNLYFYFYVLYSLANLFNSIVKVPLCFASQNKGGMWKELSKCLDEGFVQMFGRKIKQLQLFPHAPVLLKDKQL